MPSMDHAFVEAVNVEENMPRRELKVAHLVVAAFRKREGDLVQMEPGSNLEAGLENGVRPAARERLPKRLRQFESRQRVVAVRQVAKDVVERSETFPRHEDHVRIGVEHPTVARVRSSYRNIARLRFNYDQVGARRQFAM